MAGQPAKQLHSEWHYQCDSQQEFITHVGQFSSPQAIALLPGDPESYFLRAELHEKVHILSSFKADSQPLTVQCFDCFLRCAAYLS